MKRARQNLDELVAVLSAVETTWEDDHSRAVMGMLEWIPNDPAEVRSALMTHFRQNPRWPRPRCAWRWTFRRMNSANGWGRNWSGAG
jgi:hypothetical protein